MDNKFSQKWITISSVLLVVAALIIYSITDKSPRPKQRDIEKENRERILASIEEKAADYGRTNILYQLDSSNKYTSLLGHYSIDIPESAKIIPDSVTEKYVGHNKNLLSDVTYLLSDKTNSILQVNFFEWPSNVNVSDGISFKKAIDKMFKSVQSDGSLENATIKKPMIDYGKHAFLIKDKTAGQFTKDCFFAGAFTKRGLIRITYIYNFPDDLYAKNTFLGIYNSLRVAEEYKVGD